MLHYIYQTLMLLAELYICYILTAEYWFDAAVEEKKHKRTRTTKKTTTTPTGDTVEEQIEITETSNNEQK